MCERSLLTVRCFLLNASHASFFQGESAKAQPLFERALVISERALRANHPSTITSRAWMADLYKKQSFLDKASPVLEEVVSARERVRGRDHPNVASALNNRAGLLQNQVRAVRFYRIFLVVANRFF